MSEPKLISPLLDNFTMGGPISEHHGVQCCPAIKNDNNDKYIVKIVSVPSSSAQIDALLLSGAYSDEASALLYFKELSDDVSREADILSKISEFEGFLPYTGFQTVSKDNGKGYDVYLISPYKRSLEKHFKRHNMTHLDALNLGLDLCAALSVCRRIGYLYVDLKPSNVFVTGERLYRIGDLGFIKLDSLKYASLPEKYMSIYTPPEISDAFSSLNTTIDVYAAGLILYQAYNNGALPFHGQVSPGDQLPSPLYADYEMSEIILKACAPDPADRWQDPMQMGQAIISYMQRNGAMDTPIVPIPTNDEAPSSTSENEESIESNTQTEPAPSNTTVEIEDQQELDGSDPSVSSDENIFSEDEFGNLSFLSDVSAEDLLLEVETNYDSVSEEVSDILNQADTLAALSVPEPVVVPEYVELMIPELSEITADAPKEETEEIIINEQSEEHEEVILSETSAMPDNIQEEKESELGSPIEASPKKKRHWLRNSILIILLLGLLFGCYYYYQNYYLLPIESIILDGTEDSLEVLVNTNIDEDLLQVICSDTYGNQTTAKLENGKAVFHDLVAGTAYTVKVVSDDFHRVVGNTATAYSTPIQSNIVQFDAITGSNDGSVILSFTVEGPDCSEWTILYSAQNEKERSATFGSHMVTLTDLTVGKEYTFRLVPNKDLYLTGITEITYTASKLVRAENLVVNSCANNMLTVSWSAPEDSTVENWSVICSNDTYTETIITPDSTVTFQGIDHNAAYNIEVKAAGMSVSQMITVPENSVTATSFHVDTSSPTSLSFEWEPSQPISADGWVLCYSIEGIQKEFTLGCKENRATLTTIIPNATYHVHLEDINGNVMYNSQLEVSTGSSVPFDWNYDGYGVHTNDLLFYMCKTPEVENWSVNDLTDNDYTTTFSIGEPASFLVRITKKYSTSSEELVTTCVIRNKDELPLQMSVSAAPWNTMWYKNYCELDIPIMPSSPGEYMIDVYFNGGLVTSQPFSIVS